LLLVPPWLHKDRQVNRVPHTDHSHGRDIAGERMGTGHDIIIYASVMALSIITFSGFMKIGVDTIARTVTARPATFILLSLFTVGCLGIGIKNLAFEPDMKMLLPEKVPARTVLKKIDDAFGAIDTIFICVTATRGTIWDPHILSQVRAISRELKSTSYAGRVLSITESKSISNDNDMMVVTNMIPEDTDFSQPGAIDAIRAKAMENNLLYKRLVSADERSTVIVATINFKIPVPAADGGPQYRIIEDQEICERLADEPGKPTLLNIMDRYADPAYKLTLSGFPYFRYDGQVRMGSDMRIFLVLGIAVMLGFLYLSFRTVRGMLLPLTIVVLGLIASFGFMGWMHEKITMPMLLMGPMLIAIAHNYGTQLIAKYYEDVQDAQGPFARDDIRRISGNCIISLGAPVLISAVTVVIGFVTMISHPIRALALLGFLCAFGIVIAFILTIVLTPSILSLLNIPQMLIDKRHGTKTDRVLLAVARFTIKHRFEMLLGVIILTGLCLYYVPKIVIDANVMNAYPKDAPIYQDANFISDQFGGYSTLNILIEANHPVGNDSPEDGPMKNPEVLRWMEDFQRFALAQTDPTTGRKLVGDALSMADYIAYMNMVMQNDPRQNRIPDSRNLIAQYLLSFENQSEGGLSDLVDFKYNKTQIILRLPDMSTARLDTLIAALKGYIEDHPNPEITVSFGGPVELVAEIGAMILDGQIWSLALSFAIIIVCYMIFFRSFSAGWLAAIPLLCAVALVFGLMGLFDIPLDSITATLTGISIGAGTDYTAYFLWRLKERAHLKGGLEDGYIETMTSIGKGIVYNGLSVVVGFVVFLFSNFMPIRFFGFLISFSILACIVSALTILPVMIFLVKPKFLLIERSHDAEDPQPDLAVVGDVDIEGT